MATIDECIEFALKNIGLWWRYRISRYCDEWKYIIIERIFESEIILIPPSLKISESSFNGSYCNTDEVWWRYGISRSCDEWSDLVTDSPNNSDRSKYGTSFSDISSSSLNNRWRICFTHIGKFLSSHSLSWSWWITNSLLRFLILYKVLEILLQ